MFGVVPKSLWSRNCPADTNNMCTWTMRCLLIEDGDRLILIDTGIGDKQSEKFFSHFYLHGNNSLEKSIQQKGFTPLDVTDVILTHLHFDHCGGAVNKIGENTYVSTFPNARYWSHSKHWEWAVTSNAREKASFLKENFMPLLENNQINFIDKTNLDFPAIDFIISNGHTEAQIIPKVNYKGKTLVYCADLMPSHHHLPIPWAMAYDVDPMAMLVEKQQFLTDAVVNNWTFMYEHDAHIECSTLVQTERGVRMGDSFSLTEWV